MLTLPLLMSFVDYPLQVRLQVIYNHDKVWDRFFLMNDTIKTSWFQLEAI